VRLLLLLLIAAILSAQTPKEVRAIAKQGSSALPQLAQFLKNPDVAIRNEATRSIVEIGTAKSLDYLIQATRDVDDGVQMRATDGLVNFYIPGYVAIGVTARIQRAGTSVKSRFVDRNNQVIEPYVVVRPDVIEAIGKLVRGGSSMDARANAARAVGILRGSQALPDLFEALRSKNTDVLYESIVALQKIGDASAGPKIQYLLRDLNEKVQFAAIETTGLLRNQAALDDLRSVLNAAAKIRIRRAALTAIAMLPDAKSRDLYTQYLTDKDEMLRAGAAEGLGRLHDPADQAMLQKAYDDELKRGPRLSLAFAMVMDGRTGVEENTPLRFLIDSLNNVATRYDAQALLIEAARDPKVRVQLYGPMEQGTKDEKIMLAQVLSRTGDRSAEPHIERISLDADKQVAEEGLRALRNLRARL
jgi:HEAT repeat protein